MSLPILIALVCFAGCSWLFYRACLTQLGKDQVLISFDRSSGSATRLYSKKKVLLPFWIDTATYSLASKSFKTRKGGIHGIACQDKVRLDIQLEFEVQVKLGDENLKKAATQYGEDLNHGEGLKSRLQGRIWQELNKIGSSVESASFLKNPAKITEELRQTLNEELEFMEILRISALTVRETPPEFLNPDDPSDAEALPRLRQKQLEKELLAIEAEREMEKIRLVTEREIALARAKAETNQKK